MTEAPPTSPFLPGTKIQYAWDSTSLGLLKTCPRLYQLTLLEGWTPKGESIHLRFGAEFHAALWNYDRLRAQGIPHEESLRETIHALLITSADFNPPANPDHPRDPARYKNRESLIRTVTYYLDDRRADPLTTHTLADGTPAVELSFRFELGWGPDHATDLVISQEPTEDPDIAVLEGRDPYYSTSLRQPYLLCGHLDRVAADANGDLFVEDHKTTTSSPGQYYFAQYDVNNQMSLYTTAGAVVLEAPIRGVAINAVQLLIEPPYARFVRGFTFRTADRLEEWQTDLSRWLQLAEWYAENSYWPQNDMACDKFGGCRFRSICSKNPSVREIYLRSDFTQLPEEERWNPLTPR